MNSPSREFDPGAVFRLVRCRQCRLVRIDPRPTRTEMARFYPEDSWPRGRGVRDPLNVRILGVPWRDLMKERAGHVLRVAPNPGRLLEIGCGDGYLLKYMQDLGWDVEGIEPAGRPSECAAALGVKVRRGFVPEAITQKENYDVVYLNHVFEHLDQPVEVLRHIRSALKSEGWLYLSVPNWASLDRFLFQDCWMGLKSPQHLFLYDFKTLSGVLAKAGLVVKASGTYAAEATTPPVGYTESFRTWLGDRGLYPKKPAFCEPNSSGASYVEDPFRSQVFWKRLLQGPERFFWNCLAAGAKAMGGGTSLQMWAQRQ